MKFIIFKSHLYTDRLLLIMKRIKEEEEKKVTSETTVCCSVNDVDENNQAKVLEIIHQ